MAIPHRLLLASLTFLVSIASSESSRLLISQRAPPEHTAPPAKPAIDLDLDLALPGEGNASSMAKPWSSPQNAPSSFGRNSGAGDLAYSGRLFRQMFMDALQKGRVPPSGPSKGTNNIKQVPPSGPSRGFNDIKS